VTDLAVPAVAVAIVVIAARNPWTRFAGPESLL
jgi:hypothetical protein